MTSGSARFFPAVLRRLLMAAGALSACIVPASASDSISLVPLGAFQHGGFAEGAAEIPAYDPGTRRLFVVNAQAARVDVLDLSDPTHLVQVGTLEVTAHGAVANSVAAHRGLVAVAVEAAEKTDPGRVVFFTAQGQFLSSVRVGALPDMVTFTPDGRWVLVANEGEPDDSYTVDPEGSVSVIDVSRGGAAVTQGDVRTAGFGAFNDRPLPPSVRVFGPGANAARDFEPEFIAASRDSRLAWVTLQENNAIAILDVAGARMLTVRGLGFKNHLAPHNGLDASDRDGAINIAGWPVNGMYLPDAIGTYEFAGLPFLVMANEGDSRDYSGFSEETRVGDETLDPVAFPNAAALQQDAALGRLKITNTAGDVDGDGDYDRLFSFGARSLSIRTATGHLVWDSGDLVERVTAAAYPAFFNSNEDDNDSFDSRSDDKGPEAEGVVLGRVGFSTYAFLGLERIGGIVVFDVTIPWLPRFVQYVNTRDFAGDPEAGTAGDLAPEGLVFISAQDSPTGHPLLAAAYEISGTTRVFAIR